MGKSIQEAPRPIPLQIYLQNLFENNRVDQSAAKVKK